MVNEWIINENEGDERKYELLIMSPTEIERLDRPEGQEQFENKLDPGDIDLSAAMATSAAAVARNMGSYDDATVGLKQLQTVLGLGMGSSLVSDNGALKRESCFLRVSFSQPAYSFSCYVLTLRLPESFYCFGRWKKRPNKQAKQNKAEQNKNI